MLAKAWEDRTGGTKEIVRQRRASRRPIESSPTGNLNDGQLMISKHESGEDSEDQIEDVFEDDNADSEAG